MEIQNSWITTLNSAGDAEKQLLDLALKARDQVGFVPDFVSYFRNILIGQFALYIDLETGQKAIDRALESTNDYAEKYFSEKEV
jgi:hypothetical protein